MSLRDIVFWPDARLEQICDRADPSDPALARLADDMLETMYAAPGRGLAAPQVGVLTRLFVMDAGWKAGTPDPLVCVNPVLQPLGAAVRSGEERCLSIPDTPMIVTRPARVRLSWTTLDGRAETRELDGEAAVIAQHEADHLDGRLILSSGTTPE